MDTIIAIRHSRPGEYQLVRLSSDGTPAEVLETHHNYTSAWLRLLARGRATAGVLDQIRRADDGAAI